MSDENYKWSNLISKYLSQEITPAELEELYRQMKQSPLKEQQFDELTDPKKRLEGMKDIYRFDNDVNAAWQRLMAKHSSVEFATGAEAEAKKYHVKELVVAAMAISVFIIVGYFLSRNNAQKTARNNFRKQPGNVLQQQKEVFPILRLYDGREFSLVASRKMNPILIDNGVISYENGIVKIEVINNNSFSQSSLNNVLTIPSGQQISLCLSDNSCVKLNSASSIKFPIHFAANERRLELTGEAFFTIAENRKKPCVVEVNSALQILVYGTTFNVSGYAGEEFKTTLIEGEITITKGKKRCKLEQGQQARLVKDEIVIDSANVNNAIAWTKDELDLNNKNVREVLKEIGRKYDKEVIFNGSFSDKTYDVQIPFAKGLPRILEMLQKINHIKITDSCEKLIATNMN